MWYRCATFIANSTVFLAGACLFVCVVAVFVSMIGASLHRRPGVYWIAAVLLQNVLFRDDLYTDQGQLWGRTARLSMVRAIAAAVVIFAISVTWQILHWE